MAAVGRHDGRNRHGDDVHDPDDSRDDGFECVHCCSLLSYSPMLGLYVGVFGESHHVGVDVVVEGRLPCGHIGITESPRLHHAPMLVENAPCRRADTADETQRELLTVFGPVHFDDGTIAGYLSVFNGRGVHVVSLSLVQLPAVADIVDVDGAVGASVVNVGADLRDDSQGQTAKSQIGNGQGRLARGVVSVLPDGDGHRVSLLS